LAWATTGLVAFSCFGEPEERSGFISTAYLMIQLITTVGYGDLHPTSEGMRFFMGCFVLVGNFLVALVLTSKMQSLVHRSHDALKGRMVERMVEGAKRVQRNKGVHSRGKKADTAEWSVIGDVVIAFAVYMLFLLVGALYYGVWDNCLASETQDYSVDGVCEERRSFVTGFYMSAVTLTTVGFGDQTPANQTGRVFGIFWMFFGVSAMANFLGEVAHLILVEDMHRVSELGISHDLFKKMDQDGSGTLTKFEFTTYMLVKYSLVTEEDLDLLLEEFDNFDVDENEELSYEEISGAP